MQGHRDEKRSKTSDDPKEDLSAVYKYKFYVNIDPKYDVQGDAAYSKETKTANKSVLKTTLSTVSVDKGGPPKCFPLKLYIYDKQTVTVTDTEGKVVPPQNMHKITVKQKQGKHSPLGDVFQKFLEKKGMIAEK